MLAEKHDVPLVLDASWFNAEGWAEVSHFLKLPIKAKVLRPSLAASLASRALRNYLGKHYWEYLGVPVLREAGEDHSFDARFLDAPADCMLSGFFQSPLYFESIADSLRAELNGLLAQAAVARASCPPPLLQRLSQANSVAVHVRRKDYLDLPVFQVCDSIYYRESIHKMRSDISEARFFVFSDDPDWCRGEFRDEDTEVIDSGNAAKNPLHDLHLMSLTKHHIIANSSYSWWAAWLGDTPDQQVIMPERWFTHGIKVPMREKRWK
jgi:hypothetical protein